MTWKPTLIVDFDGVIHSYSSGWTGLDEVRDPPVPGAMDFLRSAVDHFKVAIFSSRSSDPGGKEAMQAWLAREAEAAHGYHAWVHEIIWPDHKIPALVQLDDRAITFTGVFPDPAELLDFKPWNKK